mmetsp:Transcript_25570/g.74627  ORF Transcript_25570/g.74627 Transcript_25570/m.74627 type:complete len:225 (-) Transcript_25570:291-965(-)
MASSTSSSRSGVSSFSQSATSPDSGRYLSWYSFSMRSSDEAPSGFLDLSRASAAFLDSFLFELPSRHTVACFPFFFVLPSASPLSSFAASVIPPFPRPLPFLPPLPMRCLSFALAFFAASSRDGASLDSPSSWPSSSSSSSPLSSSSSLPAAPPPEEAPPLPRARLGDVGALSRRLLACALASLKHRSKCWSNATGKEEQRSVRASSAKSSTNRRLMLSRRSSM